MTTRRRNPAAIEAIPPPPFALRLSKGRPEPVEGSPCGLSRRKDRRTDVVSQQGPQFVDAQPALNYLFPTYGAIRLAPDFTTRRGAGCCRGEWRWRSSWRCPSSWLRAAGRATIRPAMRPRKASTSTQAASYAPQAEPTPAPTAPDTPQVEATPAESASAEGAAAESASAPTAGLSDLTQHIRQRMAHPPVGSLQPLRRRSPQGPL